MKSEKSSVKIWVDQLAWKISSRRMHRIQSKNRGRGIVLWSLFLNNCFCKETAVSYSKKRSHNIKKTPSGEDAAQQIFFWVFIFSLKNENFDVK